MSVSYSAQHLQCMVLEQDTHMFTLVQLGQCTCIAHYPAQLHVQNPNAVLEFSVWPERNSGLFSVRLETEAAQQAF